MRILTKLFFSLSLFASVTFAGASTTDTSAPDWNLLFRDTVLVTPVEKEDGISGVRALFTIHAPKDSIWSTLLDYDHYPQIFDGVKKVLVLKKDSKGDLLEYTVGALLREGHYTLQRYFDSTRTTIRWERVSGDLQRLEGFWNIRRTPREGTFLIVYETYVVAGGWIPQSLVRRMVRQKTYTMGFRLRAWVEKRNIASPPRQPMH
jgi:hypothetical protein